ncbi:MAG: hypothetical protein NTY25_11440 [Planctomycetia bacterium]|nr:hypothetical protein [Planctomycetia bacterium]
MLRIPAELEKGHKDRLLPMALEFSGLLEAVSESERSGPVFSWSGTTASQADRHQIMCRGP